LSSGIHLGFSYLKNPWEEEHVFSVELTIMFKRVLALPGFAPPAELVAWRVSKGAAFVDSAKVAKTM
jgi:hypothetical protein